MTEALRDYLEERFRKVRSGYGASDLTIVVRAARGGPPGAEPCLGRDGLLLDVLPALRDSGALPRDPVKDDPDRRCGARP